MTITYSLLNLNVLKWFYCCLYSSIVNILTYWPILTGTIWFRGSGNTAWMGACSLWNRTSTKKGTIDILPCRVASRHFERISTRKSAHFPSHSERLTPTNKICKSWNHLLLQIHSSKRRKSTIQNPPLTSHFPTWSPISESSSHIKCPLDARKSFHTQKYIFQCEMYLWDVE